MSWWSKLFRRAEPPDPTKVGKVEEEPMFRAPGAWTMDQVEAALDDHERGDFRESGRLVDALLCDEEVASLIGLRTGTVTGLPFHFEPEPPGVKQDWEYVFPVEAQDDVLFKTLMMGFAFCQDSRRSHDELPCWSPWPSEAVQFDTYRKVWQVETQRGGLVDIQPGDGHWALFQSRFARPWMAAYVRAIAPMVIIRQSTLYNCANHSQVYATPSRILKAPRQMAEMDDMVRAVGRLKKLVGDSTIVLPEGLEMQLLELKEVTYKIYLELRKAIDEALAILFVGQLGTTKAAGGWGSAHTERRVTQQLLERDVRILQTAAHRQIVAPYDRWKRGTRNLSLVPKPVWEVTPPVDKMAEAQRANQEADARYKSALELKTLAALDFGDGWRVDMVKVAGDRGIPVRKVKPEEMPAPAPAAPTSAPDQEDQRVAA